MVIEQLLEFEKRLVGKRILVTGHTGFIGSWCCLWLSQIGADVYGVALPPATNPSLFSELRLAEHLHSEYHDICNYQELLHLFEKVQPELVLHLAAQPLVRFSYAHPLDTFQTNTMGTAYVLEAIRNTSSVKAVVCMTTDKVYKNNNQPWSYRENDILGGSDPYSASKAAAEMVIDSYRYFYGHSSDHRNLGVATIRGGNIIGGGDWAPDRLVPDFVRAVISNQTLKLRYPEATRPWQHVLALAQGCLMVLARLLENPARYSQAWNLGPSDMQAFSVRNILEILSQSWVAPKIEYATDALPEAKMLGLDSTLARNELEWLHVWNTQEAILKTAEWYKEFYKQELPVKELTLLQLLEWRSGLQLLLDNKGQE
ncbi:MAG: CDP-glucose 4,6-dehydratase [Gammaproteobacteria bacterium]